MARRPAVDAKPKTTLPTDWRADGYWKIIAMMNKIAPGDYNGEARRFATHHIQAGTVSDDWRGEFRSWCRARLTAQVSPPVQRKVRPRLFG